MTTNKLKGEEQLDINGETYTVVYDWDGLAKLNSFITREELALVIQGKNMNLLADVLAIGLSKHHGEFTAEEIKDMRPPFVHACKAIENALTYAYFGDESPDDVISDKKKSPKSKPKKKK